MKSLKKSAENEQLEEMKKTVNLPIVDITEYLDLSLRIKILETKKPKDRDKTKQNTLVE